MARKAYDGCKAEILGGRKLWIARRGGGPGSVPEIWVHESPYTKAIAYVRGSSLYEGDPDRDRDYLLSLVADDIARLKPMSAKLEALWDAEITDNDEALWHAENAARKTAT